MKRLIGVLLLLAGGALLLVALYVAPILQILIIAGKYLLIALLIAGEYLLIALLIVVPATLVGILSGKAGVGLLLMKRLIGVLLLLAGGALLLVALYLAPILQILIMGYIGTGGREAGEYLLIALLIVVPATLVGILFIRLGIRLVRKPPARFIA